MSMPNFSLAGKVALVTGAGRGIGLGIAKALAGCGASVAIQDIQRDVAQAEVDQINRSGGRAVALGGDITDLELPTRLVDETVAQLGGLHILVNNAAIQLEKDWVELSVEEIESQIRADQIAPILLCQRAVPIFRAQSWGRILNIGSIQQKVGVPVMLAYSMSKAALMNLTLGLARELAADGITVNCIAPGFFVTHRNRHLFNTPEDVTEKAHWVPMRRAGLPEDCAGAAILFCSDAGAYITGQCLYVDGGMSTR